MDPTRFEADRLIEEACSQTGEDDFGEPGWREGLDILLGSLIEEARLNDVGVEVAASDLRLPRDPLDAHWLAPGPP